MKKETFSYPSVLDSEYRAYIDVKRVLEATGIPPRYIQRIMLAVSEGFTNALIHGNNYEPDKIIEIRITINDEAVYAEVIDEGICDLKAITERKCPTSTDEGGRGIDLMETMSDEMEIHKNDRTGGLQVSMKFYKSGFERIREQKAIRR